MFPNGQDGPSTDHNQPQQAGPQYTQQPSSPIFHIEPAPTSKKRGVLIGVIVGAIVLLIATIAILYVVLVLGKSKEEEGPAPLEDVNSVLLVSDLRKHLKETYPQEGEPVKGKPVLTTEESADSPVYIPDGYQYGVQYESDTAFTFSLANYVSPDKVASEKEEVVTSVMDKAVTDYFKKEQLTVSEAGKAKTIFTGRGVVCELDVTVLAEKESGAVRCGESKEFKRLAAEMQPFVESLTGVDRTMSLRDLKTADSPTGGYRQASLKITDSANKVRIAVFYKKDSGRWLTISSSESGTLACTEFKTLEMQRAYLNTPCTDAQNKGATVQIIEKRS